MRLSIQLLALIFILVLSSSVLGLTASIGNARMVVRLNVGEEIEKYVLVKNVNNVSVNINVTVTGDLEKYVKIKDNNFVLNPGEEKKAYFGIAPKKNGTFETLIGVSFSALEGEYPSVGLQATVITIVGGVSEEDETNLLDSLDVTESVLRLFGKKSGDDSSNFPLLLLTITTIVLVVLLLALFALYKKRRRKNEGDNKTKKKI